MAGRKELLLLLLLCIAFILAFAHLAHADWSSQYEDDWYNYKKKPAPIKKQRGYYNGVPIDDDDDGQEYMMQPSRPFYKPFPFRKPFHKQQPKRPSMYKPRSPPYMYQPQPPQISAPATPPPQTRSPPISNPPPRTPPLYKPQPPLYEPPQTAPPIYNKPLIPSPSPPKTPSYTPSSSLQQQWLHPHNAARAELGLPPMVWSDKVAQYAESWANQRKANGCGLQHSDGPYGENIFWGSGGGYGPAECVAAWVKEKQYYNYADNSCAPGQQCGHYTQIVWATSVNLGCAKVQCDSGQIFMTCNYDPPGNWIGSKPY